MQGFLAALLLTTPFLGVHATPQPAFNTVTLVHVIDGYYPTAALSGEIAQVSAVGTAKGGADTTYDLELVGTATLTNAAGSTLLTTETEHATLIEGAKGYTLSVATSIADAQVGTGTAVIVEECTFGGNCVDVASLPAWTATITYSGTTAAFATITVPVGKNSAVGGYRSGGLQLAALVTGVLVGLLVV